LFVALGQNLNPEFLKRSKLLYWLPLLETAQFDREQRVKKTHSVNVNRLGSWMLNIVKSVKESRISSTWVHNALLNTFSGAKALRAQWNQYSPALFVVTTYSSESEIGWL
jgi:hypothetical protein